jgi:hypothetical protein
MTFYGSNMDFELYTGTQDNSQTDAFDDWVVNAVSPSFVQATAYVKSGNNAVSMRWASEGPVSIYHEFTPVLLIGQYQLKLWSGGDRRKRTSVYVEMTGDVEGDIIPLKLTGGQSTVYQESTHDFEVTANNNWIRLEFSNRVPAAVLFLDNVSVSGAPAPDVPDEPDEPLFEMILLGDGIYGTDGSGVMGDGMYGTDRSGVVGVGMYGADGSGVVGEGMHGADGSGVVGEGISDGDKSGSGTIGSGLG